ncbi:ribosomal protein S5 [Oscillibacter sp. CAG:155]|nr:ribosomal protein S5 [Oscillibacter sp. CAG:155]
MGHSQNGTGKTLKIIFQDGKGRNVQIVGGLVQQQHIGRRHQDGQQIQPPPLSAGEPADGHRLQVPREEKTLHHLVCGKGSLVRLHFICDVVDKVIDPLVQVQLPSLLGEVADLDGCADRYAAAVRRQFPGDQMQQCGFSGAVVAHDADPVPPQKMIGEMIHHGFAVKGLCDVVQFNDLFPQTAGSRGQLHGVIRLRRILVPQGLVSGDPLLGFGGPGPAAPHDPLPLHPEDGLALALTGLGHFRPLLFQLQILGVIGLVVVQLSPAQLRDMVDHPLQKITVVGHHDQPALEAAEPVLQPGHHLTVQMVGGLVQDQHVRRTQQRRGQRHTLALAAGESADFLFKIRQPQPVEHGLCLIFVQGPELRREVEKHLLQHSGIILHHRVLGQETHLHIGIAGNGAVVRLRDAGQDFHKGGLSGAVDTDDAGLVPFVEIKVDIIQQLAAAEIDREMFRG